MNIANQFDVDSYRSIGRCHDFDNEQIAISPGLCRRISYPHWKVRSHERVRICCRRELKENPEWRYMGDKRITCTLTGIYFFLQLLFGFNSLSSYKGLLCHLVSRCKKIYLYSETEVLYERNWYGSDLSKGDFIC